MKVKAIISALKNFIKDDEQHMSQRPKEYPRAAWRNTNARAQVFEREARDTRYKTRPKRVLRMAQNSNPYDIWVWSIGRDGLLSQCIERIDLKSKDAQERLDRYEAI